MPKRGSPPGTFWRGDVLWGRIQVKGQDVRWSLRTGDPKLARERLKADRERLIAQAHYGTTTRRLFDEVLAEWARHIPDQVGARTARRYACSLHMLQPFLAGKHIDEVNGALVADIIRKRGTVDGATNATVKRDLVALSSVFNFAIDQGWAELNPVLPRMKRRNVVIRSSCLSSTTSPRLWLAHRACFPTSSSWHGRRGADWMN
jgi:integrase/recombinase XerD